MKLPFLVICMLSLVQSNKQQPVYSVNDIDVIISNSETYKIDVGASGDEEGASIYTQAQHFQKSDIIRDASTNWSNIYEYKPLSNYTGTDSVIIETCTGGAIVCNNINRLRIHFTITD